MNYPAVMVWDPLTADARPLKCPLCQVSSTLDVTIQSNLFQLEYLNSEAVKVEFHQNERNGMKTLDFFENSGIVAEILLVAFVTLVHST